MSIRLLSSSIIKNISKPVYMASSRVLSGGPNLWCINCIHFIEHKTNYPYDDPPNDKLYGKCSKFGTNNLITGEIEYDFALNSRNNQTKCGIYGKFFKEKIIK